ncbi:MAG: alpha/beta hydrolase [Ilumatobacter sp.]|nr:alpha/beta hydrolase [Actinomycetota bacterium]
MSTTADDTDSSVDDAVDGEPPAPELPPATPVELAGLGEVDVREVPGPEGAPAVILIHGWTASADINFFTCYRALGEHVRVIAFDQRGHGSGLRTRRVVRLEDCADDVARVADALGIDTFIPVGYSMGGTIAQLTWRRHRDRVDGLVLAATAPHFAERRDERLSFLGLTGLAALARVTPTQARDRISDQVYLRRKTETWGPWAVAQAARHDWRMVLEAGRALGNFSSTDWLGEIDVPTSVVVTMRDPVVPLRRQVRLFDEIPGAEAFRVDGEHDAVVANADRFVPTLIRAIGSVTSRIVSAG